MMFDTNCSDDAPCHHRQAMHKKYDNVPTILDEMLLANPGRTSGEGASTAYSMPQETALPTTATALLLFAAASAAIGLTIHRRRAPQTKSKRRPSHQLFPTSTNLPPCEVPPHRIFGHMQHVFSPPDCDRFNSIFVKHANPSGLSTFLFLKTPSVSVLKAEHAKIVFRNSIERSGAKIISRHFKRCLGEGEFGFSLVSYVGT